MNIPRGLDPQKRYKLTIWNASSARMSGGAMRPRWIRGSRQGWTGHVISAAICDRGECHYGNDIHEQETLEGIQVLQTMFPIDPLQISKMGGSKDGFTSVSLGVHYPHLFSYTYATAANSLPEGTTSSIELPCFAPGRDLMNCFFMAENMYSLPAAIVTGFDGSHICSTTMGALLEKVGAPDKLIRVEPEGGHGSTKWTEAEVDKWAAEQRLNPYPKRVHVSTSTLTYNKFYWVEVDELERQNHFATMRVDALDDNRIEVETKGIARFTLVSLDHLTEAGKPVTVEIDDVALPAALPRDGELSFAKRSGKWAVYILTARAGTGKEEWPLRPHAGRMGSEINTRDRHPGWTGRNGPLTGHDGRRSEISS